MKRRGQGLQELLVRSSVGTARQVQVWIAKDSITINGKVASQHDRVTRDDRVQLKGQDINLSWYPETTRVIAHYKSKGHNFQSLPKLTDGSWLSISQLGIDTTGLLLFCNDRALLSHFAKHYRGAQNEYIVSMHCVANEEVLQELGIDVRPIEVGTPEFCHYFNAHLGETGHHYSFTFNGVQEIKFRRLLGTLGLGLEYLLRTKFSSYSLPTDKKPGESWELDEDEIQVLLDALTYQN